MFGMRGAKLGAGLGKGSPRVVLKMPVERRNARQEILARSGIGDQLFVKVARVPLNQHFADIEDDGANGHKLFSPGEP